MNKFQQTTPPAWADRPVVQPTQQPSYSDRQFMHTFVAGALLPLVQASITAVMVGIGTLTVLYLFDAIDLLKPTLIVSALAWVLTWLYLQRRWINLTALEQALKLDINRDGHIGEEPKITRVQVDEITPQGHIRQMKFIDLPIGDDKLTVLARGLLGGRAFSEREWAGSGKIMSSNEFRTLRSEMIKRGLLEMANEKDQRQGYVLTHPGRAVMRKFADLPSPTPDVEGV